MSSLKGLPGPLGEPMLNGLIPFARYHNRQLGIYNRAKADAVLNKKWKISRRAFGSPAGENDVGEISVGAVSVSLDNSITPLGKFCFEGDQALPRSQSQDIGTTWPVLE